MTEPKRPFGCKCETLTSHLTGDGCDECNKQMAIDLLQEDNEQKDALISDLRTTLESLADNADEDCPSEYRTTHFKQALKDAYTLLADLQEDDLNH